MHQSLPRNFALHSSRVECLHTTSWLNFVSLTVMSERLKRLVSSNGPDHEHWQTPWPDELRSPPEAQDDFELHLQRQVSKLREELNYLYNQMHRSVRGAVQSHETNSALERELLERERKLLEITRQLQHRVAKDKEASEEKDYFSIAQLQAALGADRARVEYTTIDDKLIAFVLTDQTIRSSQRSVSATS